MSLGTAKVADLKIPSGAAVSNILSWRDIEDGYLLMLYGPAALDAGHTYVFQVTYAPEPKSSSTWYVVQIGNPLANMNPPATGCAQVYPELMAANGIRILDQTGNVGADRIWKVTKHFYMGVGF